MGNHSRVNRLLSKTPMILGCLLFLCSSLLPFCRFQASDKEPSAGEGIPSLLPQGNHAVRELSPVGSLNYSCWSFKVNWEYHYHWDGMKIPEDPYEVHGVAELWLVRYWFSERFGEIGLSWVFVAIFGFQAATLVYGIGSLFFRRRILLLLPALTSTGAFALMNFVPRAITLGHLKPCSFEIGFWLIFPAIALFILNAASESLFSARKPEPNTNQENRELKSTL